jgi:hypothetical protein
MLTGIIRPNAGGYNPTIPAAAPLIEAVYERMLERGAFPSK